MTLVASRPVRTHRPASVIAIISMLVFLGVTALGGGFAMVFGLGGDKVMLPDQWLDAIPVIDSWLWPGLILGVGFGLGSLLTAYGALSRPRWAWLFPFERSTGHHWAWAATILIGAAHVVWIILELLFLPEMSWFHPLYGAVGLALLLMPFLPSATNHLRVR
jgi:hypothetical protein